MEKKNYIWNGKFIILGTVVAIAILKGMYDIVCSMFFIRCCWSFCMELSAIPCRNPNATEEAAKDISVCTALA